MRIDGVMLEKANRITAWLAFLIVAVYIVTGFGMVGMWGMSTLIGRARSQYWHSSIHLAYVLIVVLAVHALICVYRTLKRNKVI